MTKQAHGRLKVGITYQTHLWRIVESHFAFPADSRRAPDNGPSAKSNLLQLDTVVVYGPWWLGASTPRAKMSHGTTHNIAVIWYPVSMSYDLIREILLQCSTLCKQHLNVVRTNIVRKYAHSPNSITLWFEKVYDIAAWIFLRQIVDVSVSLRENVIMTYVERQTLNTPGSEIMNTFVCHLMNSPLNTRTVAGFRSTHHSHSLKPEKLLCLSVKNCNTTGRVAFSKQTPSSSLLQFT